MSDIVITAEHLSKLYRLGTINNGTLWKDLQSWTAIKLGKEDPHSKIGEDRFSGDVDHFWALKDISFDIKQGDRVGIIGKNGAGKSTLLKILSRVTSPTEGNIKIKGKIASLLEVGTGFNAELTGRENIYLNGAILGMKKRQIDRKLDEIINFSEIEHHIDTPVKRYSSGMYVRLAFAVAAHLDSDILIADEVLAVGDMAFQKKALGKMNDLSTGQGRTVLFVSHNMGAVKQLCNTGFLMEKGRILSIQPINDCIDDYYNSNVLPTTSSMTNFTRNKNCSLRCKIIQFQVITDEGINTGIIHSDKKLTIKFIVESYKDSVVTAMQCFISHNEQNMILLDSGHIKNQMFTLDRGIYEMSCEITSLGLYAGTYSLSIGLDIPGIEQIDQIPDAYRFEIPRYDPANTGFNLHIESNWGVYNPEQNYTCVKQSNIITDGLK